MKSKFKIKENHSSYSKEIIGGLTTFLSMAYILAVNPMILSSAGMSWGAVFSATAISAAIASILMGILANMPIALAPGLGLNAFFTYTVVLGMGCSYKVALTAVLIEGIIFIIFSLCGVRSIIMKSIPESIQIAISIGIGLFICIIGFVNAGICSSDTGTIIGFVSFDKNHMDAVLAIIGLILTITFYILKIPGFMLLSIIITTIIGIFLGVTTIPENFNFFKKPELPAFFHFDFKYIFFNNETGSFSIHSFCNFFIIVFTFLFSDMFDTIGCLLGIANQDSFIEKKDKIINHKGVLLSDSIGTVVGACLGTSTVTSFVESLSGIAAGARTGFASVITGLLFIVALIFGDLFLLIPSAAVASALIFVGFLMIKSVGKIQFNDPTEGIPAFITIIVMPFSYSISNGIVWGIISYVFVTILYNIKATIEKKDRKQIPVITYILAIIFLLYLIF